MADTSTSDEHPLVSGQRPNPADDRARLQALEQYELLDMPRDPALDDLARLAAQLCNAPVGAVTLMEKDRITFVGRFGVELGSTRRNLQPWEATLHGDGVYQIPDSRRDPKYSPGGIPLGDRRYRFFAAAPVFTARGVPIGCVCVLDNASRQLTPAQMESLESVCDAVTTRLELLLRIREQQRASRARQRVETALTVERNFVAAVLDTVGALVVVFDTAGRIVRFNRACEMISGYNSTELVGKYAWERLIPEEDIPEYINSFERIRAGEFPTTYENHWLASDGTRRHISWSATALVDSQSQVAFVIATGIDVTTQRAAENAIRESEARYRQLIEGSLGLVCTHDLKGNVLSINEYGAANMGLRTDDVVGHRIQEFVTRGRLPLIQHYLRELIRTGEAQGLLRVRHVSGEDRVFAYRNRMVEPLGHDPYVLAFAIDITEQMRAEEQLRALIRQSNSVLESVGDGIFGIDLEGRATVVNPAAAQMLGYRPSELLGRNIHELIHHTRADATPYPLSESPIQASLSDLKTIRVSSELFWRKDGTSFPVEYVARPQIESEIDETPHHPPRRELASGHSGNGASAPGASRGNNLDVPRGRAVGVVVAFTDISERNALDRMKDEFISTVSHELRTPLTSLRAALGLVAGGALTARPDKARQMMDIAVGNTDRLVKLVNDILDLERIGSGKAELHVTRFSVGELMRRSTQLLQASAAKVNIFFTIDAEDVQVWADSDRILQTLTNLISNAIKFSPQDSTPSEIKLTARYLNPEEAVLEVQDHGRGIPHDKLQQIFERFKQVDASDSRAKGGTGLGLAICRSIVQQHGGQIWATSTLGEGSTFHFTLPTQPTERLT